MTGHEKCCHEVMDNYQEIILVTPSFLEHWALQLRLILYCVIDIRQSLVELRSKHKSVYGQVEPINLNRLKGN